MTENDIEKTEGKNLMRKFLAKYPHLKDKNIAKALRISKDQISRLKRGKHEIMSHIKERLWRLDHFLKNDGKIEDFKLPEYGEEDE